MPRLSRALVAAALLAATPLASAECDNKNCDRTDRGLGRSAKAAPAAKPLPVLPQPWAIAQSVSGYVIVVDPWGNVFTGPAGGGAEAPEYRGNLQRVTKEKAYLQPRHYNVALGGANGEQATVVDNLGHVYAGPIRPPVAFAQVARAVRLQGGRGCDKVDCE